MLRRVKIVALHFSYFFTVHYCLDMFPKGRAAYLTLQKGSSRGHVRSYVHMLHFLTQTNFFDPKRF